MARRYLVAVAAAADAAEGDLEGLAAAARIAQSLRDSLELYERAQEG